MLTILRKELSSLTYRSLCLPDDIADRGLKDVPNFYYRDDGLKLWDIIFRLHRMFSYKPVVKMNKLKVLVYSIPQYYPWYSESVLFVIVTRGAIHLSLHYNPLKIYNKHNGTYRYGHAANEQRSLMQMREALQRKHSLCLFPVQTRV